MSHKTGRNDPCPCGSGKKHKKCCAGDTPANIDADSWIDQDGMHFTGKGPALSEEDKEKMTKEYQENVKNSQLWQMMIKEYGKEKAEEMLKEFQVKSG